MNKNERLFSLKGKGMAVSIVIGFIAVIVMVGAYTFNNYSKKLSEQLAKSEELTEQITKEKSAAVTTDDILPLEKEKQDTKEEVKAEVEKEEDKVEREITPKTEENLETTGNTSLLSFNEESLLEWPASGAVLINYSMDKTVFFSTLEQYQYNPALIINGKVDEVIMASAAGVVVNIEELAQTGLTVTLDMGNGYAAIYGQLKDISVGIGDYVEVGGHLGSLNEPTKYFTVEGPNLYFAITKDGEPVNPLSYMES